MVEPFAWYRYQQGERVYYDSKKWEDCQPLYIAPQGVQVSPIEFVERTFGRGHLVGMPVIWAEWPSKEKNGA